METSVFMCNLKILLGMGVVGALLYVQCLLKRKFWTLRNFAFVGEIRELRCCPVASCAGMRCSRGLFTEAGLRTMGGTDRQFVITKKATKDFARDYPVGTYKQFYCDRIKTIQSYTDGRSLVLAALGSQSLTLPLRKTTDKHGRSIDQIFIGNNLVNAVDTGYEPSQWLKYRLKERDLRLHLCLNNVFTTLPGRSAYGNYVISSRETAHFINKWINPFPEVTEYYFRPNIIIAGCPPLMEDRWEELRIGNNVHMKVTSPDARVIQKKTDSKHFRWQALGESKAKIDDVLCFDGSCISFLAGVNAVVLREGDVHIGDPVYATYKSSSWVKCS